MDFHLVSRLKCHSGHLGSDYFDETMREVGDLHHLQNG